VPADMHGAAAHVLFAPRAHVALYENCMNISYLISAYNSVPCCVGLGLFNDAFNS
jgi:hypothetical protein